MRLLHRTFWVGVVLLAVGTVARADDPAPSFTKDVQPFLQTYCVSCHNGTKAKSGVNVEGYRALMNNKNLVVSGKADDSRLLAVLTGKAKPMPPKKRDQPTADEIKKVRAWIDAGAKDDTKVAQADPKGQPDADKGVRGKKEDDRGERDRARKGEDDDDKGKRGKRKKDDD
jgi:Planctomycete cytochrome C